MYELEIHKKIACEQSYGIYPRCRDLSYRHVLRGDMRDLCSQGRWNRDLLSVLYGNKYILALNIFSQPIGSLVELLQYVSHFTFKKNWNHLLLIAFHVTVHFVKIFSKY